MWWRKNDEIVSRNCSIEDLDAVIEGAVSIQQLPVTQNVNEPVIGDMVRTMLTDGNRLSRPVRILVGISASAGIYYLIISRVKLYSTIYVSILL